MFEREFFPVKTPSPRPRRHFPLGREEEDFAGDRPQDLLRVSDRSAGRSVWAAASTLLSCSVCGRPSRPTRRSRFADRTVGPVSVEILEVLD